MRLSPLSDNHELGALAGQHPVHHVLHDGLFDPVRQLPQHLTTTVVHQLDGMTRIVLLARAEEGPQIGLAPRGIRQRGPHHGGAAELADAGQLIVNVIGQHLPHQLSGIVMSSLLVCGGLKQRNAQQHPTHRDDNQHGERESRVLDARGQR